MCPAPGSGTGTGTHRLPSLGAGGTLWLSQRGLVPCSARVGASGSGVTQPHVLGSPFLQQHQMLSLQFEFSHLIHFRD